MQRSRRLRAHHWLVAVVGALTLALGLPAAAQAGSWGWEGFVGMGLGNGACWLYSGQSSCSPSSSLWYQINAANQIVNNYRGGTMHAGFETTSVIRGSYLNAGDAKTVYCWDVSLCQSTVKGEATWCSWCFGNSPGSSYAWFRVYS
jgi:hypothetical protein